MTLKEFIIQYKPKVLNEYKNFNRFLFPISNRVGDLDFIRGIYNVNVFTGIKENKTWILFPGKCFQIPDSFFIIVEEAWEVEELTMLTVEL